MMELNGVLVVDKPQNMTSHDVVAIMRRALNTKKIGHTGTLDPMATGVLPICVGKATKIVDFLMDRKKAYVCEMVLGSATDTQDCWGEITDKIDVFHVTEAEIVAAINAFVGEIEQIPPMYSALKVNGEKLVDLARQGIVIDREPRKRTVHSIENIDVRHHTVKFKVTCSKGTYIRTLCHDIGLKLGTYAHMTELRRVLSEPFDLQQSVTIEQIRQDASTLELIAMEDALSFMPEVRVKADERLIKRVENGVKTNFSRYVSTVDSALYYRLFLNDTFWGVLEKQADGLFVKKVLV
jgi:tRNA pseudouridine55 synthase